MIIIFTFNCITRIAQEIFWRLHKRGFIAEKSVEQLFCEHCSMWVFVFLCAYIQMPSFISICCRKIELTWVHGLWHSNCESMLQVPCWPLCGRYMSTVLLWWCPRRSMWQVWKVDQCHWLEGIFLAWCYCEQLEQFMLWWEYIIIRNYCV